MEKKDLEIDRYNLADLLETHPKIAAEWGESWVKATETRDKAKQVWEFAKADQKEIVERKRSEIALDIRQNPSHYGLDKLTDPIVAAAISASADYQNTADEWRQKVKDASDALIEAESNMNILYVIKDTMKQRKDCMDNLVRLHADQFWSVKIPRDVTNKVEREERVKKNENAKEELTVKMKRRKLNS